MNKLILSVDAGASSTKYAVIDITKRKVLQRYTGEGMFFAFNNINNCIKQITNILYNVHQSYSHIFKIYAGISGIDSAEDLKTFNLYTEKIFKKIFPETQVSIFNDSEFLVMFSKYKNRVGLISGTGSNCVGVLNNTIKAKVGGLGALLSNQGSGYHIGSMGLKKAIKSQDCRGEKTLLENEILKKYKVSNFLAVKKIIQQSDNWQKEIASIAKVVVKCANLKDKIAIKILNHATNELVLHINGINKILYKSIEPFDLIVAGNIFKAKYVNKLFKVNVVKRNNNIKKIIFVSKPLYEGPLFYYKNHNRN